jgi:hypothetical protein
MKISSPKAKNWTLKQYGYKMGKLVHREVRDFFLQKLIFAVFSTVLSVFWP